MTSPALSKGQHGDGAVGDVAILFPGLLRMLGENLVLIENLCRLHSVFFYTSREYEGLLRELDAPYHVKFIEDDETDLEAERALDAQVEGFKLKQFYKTRRCLDWLEQHEAGRGGPFRLLYKFRTDLWFPDSFSLDFSGHLEAGDTLFMESDWYFGGARIAAGRACRFYDHIDAEYYGRYDRYWPVDVDLLLRSDFGAGKFERLHFPIKAIGHYADKRDLYNAIAENRARLATHVPVAGEALGNLHPHPRARVMKFAPEPSFLHFVLASGFAVKGMDCYAPPHPARKKKIHLPELVANGTRLVQRHGFSALVRYLEEADITMAQWAGVVSQIVEALSGEGFVTDDADREASLAWLRARAPDKVPTLSAALSKLS